MRVGDAASAFYASLDEVPEWCNTLPGVAVYLPYAFAAMCARREVASFAMFDNFPTAKSFNWKCAPKPFPNTPWHEDVFDCLDACEYSDFADEIRVWSQGLQASGRYGDEVKHMFQWVSRLQNSSDSLLKGVLCSDEKRTHHEILRVLLADSLRSDAHLRPTLEMCCRFLLPPTQASDAIVVLRSRRVLNKADLSRSRFQVDADWSIYWC